MESVPDPKNITILAEIPVVHTFWNNAGLTRCMVLACSESQSKVLMLWKFSSNSESNTDFKQQRFRLDDYLAKSVHRLCQ